MRVFCGVLEFGKNLGFVVEEDDEVFGGQDSGKSDGEAVCDG